MATPFPWPAPPGVHAVRWTGRAFELDGGREEAVLRFDVGASGWSTELTELHEESGGGGHPMDVASRRRARDAVRAAVLGIGEGATILEVGCSGGHMLRDLRREFPRALVIGADYVYEPLAALARELPGVPLVQLDLARCPLPDASVDAVVALNVLEHIEEDELATRQIFRVLRPGGVAVIELPAGPGLFDVHDRALMHHRRYTLGDAVSMFERAGFRVVDRSHLGFFVFPAFAAVKLRNKRNLAASDEEQRAIVARSIETTSKSVPLSVLMRVERALGRFVRYPVGVRCVLTAVRPDGSRPSRRAP